MTRWFKATVLLLGGAAHVLGCTPFSVPAERDEPKLDAKDDWGRGIDSDKMELRGLLDGMSVRRLVECGDLSEQLSEDLNSLDQGNEDSVHHDTVISDHDGTLSDTTDMVDVEAEGGVELHCLALWEACKGACPASPGDGVGCLALCVAADPGLTEDWGQCLSSGGYWECGAEHTGCSAGVFVECAAEVALCKHGQSTRCDMWSCLQACGWNLADCFDGCVEDGLPAEQMALLALFDCVEDSCVDWDDNCVAGAIDDECFSHWVPCCEPDCQNSECGDDGCHGSCGSCNDGLPCTSDLCDAGSCVSESNVDLGFDCCTTDADCSDGIFCTQEFCHPESYECVFAGVAPGQDPPCCISDSDCNDGSSLTEDTCGEQNVCDFVIIPPDAECHSQLPCFDCDPCTDDVCVNFSCKFVKKFAGCCSHDMVCEDDNICTKNFCDSASHTCGYKVNLENPACCESPYDCEWFGESPICVNHYCGFGFQGAGCICNEIPCLICSDGNPCTCDVCFYSVCRHLTPNQAPPACNLPKSCCDDEEDCDDGNVCTKETCPGSEWEVGVGLCQWVAVPDCCNEDSECVDGIQETQDECVAHKCYHGVPGCIEDSECVDDDICTGNYCAAGSCIVVEGPEDCCTSDADCDDEDICTADICDLTSNLCDHDPLILPGQCCEQHEDCADDDPCTIDLCEGIHCAHYPMLP